MKRYIRAVSALLVCAFFAGCESAPDPAVTTAAPTATTTASAETTTKMAATTTAATTAGTSPAVDNDDYLYFGEDWELEDYEKNGYPLVAVYDLDKNPDQPDFWFPCNVIDVYFRNVSNKEIDEFIAEHGDVFEKKIGEINNLNEKQIKLVKPLTDKKSMTYDEYEKEVYEKLPQFAELSPLIKKNSVYVNKIWKYSFFDIFEPDMTETKTVTAHYERGKSFASGLSLEDYEKNGYPLVAVYDLERNPNKPYFYFPSNVAEIYFSYDSYKESEEFIAEHSDVIEKKVGENNTIDLKQVKLVKPVTDKESITYEEYIELQKGLEQQFKELSPIVDLASFYKIHINMRPDMIEPE